MRPGKDVHLIEISDETALSPDPTVSVLVLAYNHEAYIIDALESIVRQEVDFSYEILVGEDCSLDRTREIVLDYQRRHPALIRVLTSDSNVGMNENHLRLLRAARGRYVAYCEGDDFWTSQTKLALQVAFLEDRPTHGAVHSDYSRIARIRGTWRVRSHMHGITGTPPQGRVFDELLTANFISTATIVVRTCAVAAYLQDWVPQARDYPVGDWPLWLHVSACWEIGYLDAELATYRLSPGSVTNQGAAADIRRNRALVDMLGDVARHFHTVTGAERRGQVALARHVLYLSWRSSDSANAQWAKTWLDEHGPEHFSRLERSKFHILQRSRALAWIYGRYSAARHSAHMTLRYRRRATMPGSDSLRDSTGR